MAQHLRIPLEELARRAGIDVKDAAVLHGSRGGRGGDGAGGAQGGEGGGGSPLTKEPPAVLSDEKTGESGAGMGNRVFIVHGWDKAAKTAMVSFLEALHLRPMGWEEAMRESGSANSSTLAGVKAGLRTADAVIILLTPDEVCHVREELAADGRDDYRVQPRPNVIFEVGAALALDDSSKVVLVEVGMAGAFSDIDGVNTIRMPSSYEAGALARLKSRLETAGVSPVANDDRWLEPARTAGLFRAIELPPPREGKAPETRRSRFEGLPDDAIVSLFMNGFPGHGYHLYVELDERYEAPAGTWKRVAPLVAKMSDWVKRYDDHGIEFKTIQVGSVRRRNRDMLP
jgi:predicted nucleotide-binding protein